MRTGIDLVFCALVRWLGIRIFDSAFYKIIDDCSLEWV